MQRILRGRRLQLGDLLLQDAGRAAAASSLLRVVNTGNADETIGLMKGRIALTAGISHAAMKPPCLDAAMRRDVSL